MSSGSAASVSAALGASGPSPPGASADLPLLVRAGPHRTAGDTHAEIVRAWIFAAGFVGAWGAVFFGWAALRVLLAAIVASVATQWACGFLRRTRVVGGLPRAVLTGLLVGLTLPATAATHVAAAASLIAVALGEALFGGVGHYLWNPVLVGQVVARFVFGAALGGAQPAGHGPVLATDGVIRGDVLKSHPMRPHEYSDWASLALPPGKDAIQIERPDATLRRFAVGEIRPEGELYLVPLLRDALPVWRDALIGAVPGGIGETPALALIVAGLYLVYRGYLRWQLPAAMLAAAAVAAAVLPVESGGRYHWLPALRVEQGEAVGLAYVLHQLTAGGLLLCAILLAPETSTAPLRGRGQAVFGAGAGILTIFLRLYSPVPGEAYWAVLIMNTFVPLIDRQMRRPVLGIPD